ncbi:putative RNA-directed DNA polymerase, eukaryota, reverse transcriptase zinc-binding domain protein [Tanacetum coccineum]
MAIVLGNFNEVRCQNERLGTVFCNKGTKLFNNFIFSCNLVDLPTGDRKFTRMNKNGTKLSKIDRILVTQQFLSMWPYTKLTALPRDLLDHCPIIIKTHHDNFGPIPFKFYNSWLLNDELGTIISYSWCQYKVIAKLLANKLLQVVSSVLSDVQTAYIKGRQIIDNPLTVNKIISWASKKKKRLFLLKVDFEKAFDSLDWGFLDNVMKQIGFSQKWRKWITRNLSSPYSSVLVNGSPTKDFKIEKGLRQGDPFSPFLFIIAMEALYVTLEDAKLKNIFERVFCALGTYYFSIFQALKCVLNYLEQLRHNFFWGDSKIAWIAWKKDFTLHHSNIDSVSVMRKYINSRSLLTEVSDMWSSVFKWWKLDNVPNTLMDLIKWVDSSNLPDVAKRFWMRSTVIIPGLLRSKNKLEAALKSSQANESRIVGVWRLGEIAMELSMSGLETLRGIDVLQSVFTAIPVQLPSPQKGELVSSLVKLYFYHPCLKLQEIYFDTLELPLAHCTPVISDLALGWLLEEIHVTWAHLEKKRTRLRLYTKSLEETIIQTVETASPTLATTSELCQDDVRNMTMAS